MLYYIFTCELISISLLNFSHKRTHNIRKKSFLDLGFLSLAWTTWPRVWLRFRERPEQVRVGTPRWTGLSPCFDQAGEIRWKSKSLSQSHDLVNALHVPHWFFPASLSGSVWKVGNYLIHLTLSLQIYVQNNPQTLCFSRTGFRLIW